MGKHVDLQSMVDTHDRPFAVIDKDLTVIAVNEAYERAFNTPRERLVGQKCHRVLHHRDRPCYEVGEECPYSQCYTSRKACSCLHTHYDMAGRTRWVRINLFPVKAADGNVYVGEMLHEIAARDHVDKSEEVRPVGTSKAFLSCVEQLDQAAKTESPVLLVGETGTGKELAAGFIHRYSTRKDSPYVALDCTVITESLFESEVFGHEKGSFTGSVGSRRGLFEIADGGTLFLDEIGEASLSTQAKLLRVLETGEFRRVGGNTTFKANARIVCATNRNLWESVVTGQFRQDLYFRIACFCIRIPALRERLEDIPVLARSLLGRIGRDENREYHLTDEALEFLQGYDYPGNIRELRNILQVAIAHAMRSQTGEITLEAVQQGLNMRGDFESAATPFPVRAARTDFSPIPYAQPHTVADHLSQPPAAPVDPGTAGVPAGAEQPSSLKAVEARHIVELLERYSGNRRQVARALGVSERTLYRKLKRYHLSGT